MSRAEDFIRDYTSHCSNELVGGGYHEWLTPEQAMRAVEIGREELMEKAVKWIAENIDVMIFPRNAVIENFKKAMCEQ